MTPDPHGFSGQVTGLLAMSPWRRVAIAEALFMAKAVRETGEPSEAVAMGRARALAMGADIADPVTDEEILALRGAPHGAPVTERERRSV